jgi:hypothetical protein
MEHTHTMILCTGNPTHNTVASAIDKLFLDAKFASRATGFDLRFWDHGSEDFFRKEIKNYNIFINSSFICNGGQLALLETTWNVWADNNIKGHIINIGSTAEWMGIDSIPVDSVYGLYSIQKRALRDRSLQLNNKKGIKTSHIIAGGLNDGKPGHEDWLSLDQIATTIQWIISHPVQVPLIEIRSNS